MVTVADRIEATFVRLLTLRTCVECPKKLIRLNYALVADSIPQEIAVVRLG